MPSVPGVESVRAIYLATMPWHNPWTRGEQSIFVYGIEPGARSPTSPTPGATRSRLGPPGEVVPAAAPGRHRPVGVDRPDGEHVRVQPRRGGGRPAGLTIPGDQPGHEGPWP